MPFLGWVADALASASRSLTGTKRKARELGEAEGERDVEERTGAVSATRLRLQEPPAPAVIVAGIPRGPQRLEFSSPALAAPGRGGAAAAAAGGPASDSQPAAPRQRHDQPAPARSLDALLGNATPHGAPTSAGPAPFAKRFAPPAHPAPRPPHAGSRLLSVSCSGVRAAQDDGWKHATTVWRWPTGFTGGCFLATRRETVSWCCSAALKVGCLLVHPPPGLAFLPMCPPVAAGRAPGARGTALPH